MPVCTFFKKLSIIEQTQNIRLNINDIAYVLMFYELYLTSWGKEIKCEVCRFACVPMMAQN